MPDELLVDISGKLPKQSLKTARHVCSLWSTAGAKWMFQRVYFAPRQAWMERFTGIAANPHFVGNVKELIYDGRLMLPELGNFASYWSAFHARAIEESDVYDDTLRNCPDGREHANQVYQDSMWNVESIGAGKNMERLIGNDCEEFYKNVRNSLARYVRRLDWQEDSLRQGRDFKALCQGLNSFQNISKVSALVDFAHFSDYMPHINDQQDDYIDRHEWYNTRSECEFGLTVPPSRWCRRPYHQDGGKQDREEHIKWDVRGVQNLFRALSMHCPTLKELRIASMYYKAPMTIFELPDTDIERARTMFRRLTSLQLHPYVTKSDDDDAEYLRQRHCLELLLQEAKELRSLSSSQWYLEDDSEESDSEDDNVTLIEQPDLAILLGNVWPHLTELIVKGACVTKKEMMSLVRDHRATLRTLELVNMSLLDEVTWEDLGLEMGRVLRLHSVCVVGIDCTSEFSTWSDTDKRGLAFVRGAMQWALPDLLEIEEDHGRVVGRLKAGSSWL